jgi:hypothetical protein
MQLRLDYAGHPERSADGYVGGAQSKEPVKLQASVLVAPRGSSTPFRTAAGPQRNCAQNDRVYRSRHHMVNLLINCCTCISPLSSYEPTIGLSSSASSQLHRYG